MPTNDLSPYVQQVANITEGDIKKIIDELCAKARKRVSKSFGEARRNLDEREKQDQFYLLEKQLRDRLIEDGSISAFASFTGESIFTFSDYLEGEDGTVRFDALDKDEQSLLILLAFYCAYKYGIIDGRNFVGNGGDISSYVPKALDTRDYKGFVENGLQVNSIIDIAARKFIVKNKMVEALRLYTDFIEYITSPSPEKLNSIFGPDFLNKADLEKDSPYFKGQIQSEHEQLWEAFIQDYIDWEYLG